MSKISDKAKKDYLAGLRYIDIAEKYGVSINTVKSWKRRFRWVRPKQLINARKKCTQKNILHPQKISVQKRCTSEKDADCISVPDIMSEMKEEHKKFCIYYIQSQNAVASYQRAYNCKRSSALSAGYRLLNNVRVKACIQKMKQERNESMLLETGDIIDLIMRIAFANFADFACIDKNGKVVVKDLEDVDAQLIESVKSTESGVTIKLADRKWALNWLSNHFEMNPMDSHKKKYDEKLLELQERKIKNMEEGW